jgi:hypothetical protein
MSSCCAYAVDYTWVGSTLGGDGTSWGTAQNWSEDFSTPAGVPTSLTSVLLDGNVENVTTWPVVTSGTNAHAYHIFAGFGHTSSLPTLTVENNASLTVHTNGIHIGFVDDAILTNYGHIDTLMSWLFLGEGNEWGYGAGTLYMMDGQINTPVISFAVNDGAPNYNYVGGKGFLYLKNGKIFTTAVQGLHYPNSLIDIEKGYLIIDGDVRNSIDWWVSMGHLTAYGGSGTINRSYNSIYPNKTVVTAVAHNEKFGPDQWWDNYPRIVETGSLSVAQAHYANVGFTDGQRDPGWGLYGQKITEIPSTTQAFHNAGLKSIGYYETFGDGFCFLAELDSPSTSPDYNTVNCHHWNWELYSGGQTIWVGMKNWFDNESFARPWTNTHPTYGGPNMTYPDGTVATGYIDNDSTDPRKSRVYDASTSKDILGNMALVYGYNPAIQLYGPFEGTLYVPEATFPYYEYASFVSFRKDATCPYFSDFNYASILYASGRGMDGIWSDNYSAWDSFGNEPVKYAFGDWSVARFRDFLGDHFTTQELQNMGITNLATFDIRTKLKSIANSYGWNGSNLDHSAWDNSGWQDQKIWQIYMIFKRQTGTEALTDYYFSTHKAAEDAGKTDFLLQGNDIPIFNLGWARDNVDMVSTEISASWNLCSGTRGFMLPPVGRISPAYKVAREQAKSRMVNIWFYNDGYEQYLQEYGANTANPNICKLVYCEMLAHNAVPMILPTNPQNTGSQTINAEFFSFVSQSTANFGKRIPVEDIGIYYSTSSILNQMLPGSMISHASQPHQFALWGWGTALGQLQYQYRIIPEWELDSAILNELKVLIIPESEVFSSSDVTNILQPWVESGGRLIVTGVSGKRYGESGWFAINPSGYSLSPLTTVTNIASAPSRLFRNVGSGKVLYLKDNIGLNYYNYSDAANRNTLLSTFRTEMANVLSGSAPVILTVDTSFPTTVGLTTLADLYRGRFFIDLVNYDITLSSDVITASPTLNFSLQLPDWMKNKPITSSVICFGPSSSATVTPASGDALNISVSPVRRYVCVMLDIALDADVDNDNFIDLDDYTRIAAHWLNNCDATNNWCDETDVNLSNTIDIGDLAEVIDRWLEPI